IRRKRLAEVLLNHVFQFNNEQLDEAVCKFEHAVFPEIEASICTLLGHPSHCPHGYEIPKGVCCEGNINNVQNEVLPLSDMKVGEKGRVAYIRTQKDSRLHRFSGMGIRPGVVLELDQKYPSLIIRLDNAEVAMDSDIASDIYLWPSTH
ncbi:MAG: metal-dependent transcriptional regulator, partial [Planctomycetes bacterium]|nr:metal-dependent transcriptional regulator [Planctomycetota bacterium]